MKWFNNTAKQFSLSAATIILASLITLVTVIILDSKLASSNSAQQTAVYCDASTGNC